jgi:hypothetical protein
MNKESFIHEFNSHVSQYAKSLSLHTTDNWY